MKTIFNRCSATHQGFTLIEVLIAAIVLAVGLLGMAGLNATALKLSNGAQQRTQASQLAYQMGDAMRANSGYAEGYLGNHSVDACNLSFARAEGTEPAETVDKAVAELIIDDEIAHWGNQLACQLSSGEGVIARNGTLYRITVCWDHSREETLDKDGNPTVEVDPFCDQEGLKGTMHFTYVTDL
ncbi:type IV pilus modification protein PilV [Thiorhodovibrio frisius]|uniref:Type IV pilus modification protein PilV n=1 Tax=Thiorhodovibrio frisius TaxID=631362 RepID=H8YXH4_9GAMM|nr:type IV pilus modification protein PilV [Thiorhodovibrio frisius]EIC23150.1 type IV pilus modification protein PilV [Thiorhodovibrio frisius]WPL22579.1 type IV pilus modification protein PilV [Thiorhodovibrio frisius]